MATTTSTLKTEITADNKKFIAATLEARAKVKQLALAIRNEYGVALKDAEGIARRTLANTNTALKGTQAQVSKTSAAIKGLGIAFAVAFGAGALATGGLKTVYEDIDRTIASATKLDIAVDKFQALSFAAKQSDVEISTLENGIKKLRSTIATALQTGKDPFRQLGLSAKELSKLDAGDALVKIAATVNKIKSTTGQVGSVNDIFGIKQGQELLNFFRGDLEKFVQYYKTNVGGLSKTDVINFGKADEEINNLSALIKNDLQQSIISLGPAIAGVSRGFSLMAREAGSFLAELSRGISEGATAARDLLKGGPYNPNSAPVLNSRFIQRPNIADNRPTPQLQSVEVLANKSQLINVPQELNKLAVAAGAAAGALSNLKDDFMKSLGLDTKGAGQSYLNTILTSRPQAEDARFNDIANRIRDNVRDGTQGFGGSNESLLAVLKSIASDYRDNNKDLDSSGMQGAVKILEDGLKTLSTKPNEVGIRITVDKEGIIKAVVENQQFSEAVIQTAVAAADNSAREAVR